MIICPPNPLRSMPASPYLVHPLLLLPTVACVRQHAEEFHGTHPIDVIPAVSDALANSVHASDPSPRLNERTASVSTRAVSSILACRVTSFSFLALRLSCHAE